MRSGVYILTFPVWFPDDHLFTLSVHVASGCTEECTGYLAFSTCIRARRIQHADDLKIALISVPRGCALLRVLKKTNALTSSLVAKMGSRTLFVFLSLLSCLSSVLGQNVTSSVVPSEWVAHQKYYREKFALRISCFPLPSLGGVSFHSSASCSCVDLYTDCFVHVSISKRGHYNTESYVLRQDRVSKG